MAQQAPRHNLTRREQAVLRMIAAGQNSRSIATELGVSVLTVRKHRSNLLAKTGARNAAQLTSYAVEHGFRRARRLVRVEPAI
ncbi:response regulator transcription factor [Cupriavidus consociatus]|uniref:response regulator transcription factor n=1 Tax=Cupriavidus consociatus TaxID=2821357 RepID=UPI001AEBA16E|nr:MULTISPECIES: LuxR C-terminal-related transcriptional regulator [unclassified Cupriavidus]MBP0622442.1 response regulator transcription factor [Cupriavidus sp. LEh25]MDK2659128.1 LuxR C-terminal-related transcriptional regulator [Cupriavidus sp. LEh21]